MGVRREIKTGTRRACKFCTDREEEKKYPYENEEEVNTGTEMGMGMANMGDSKESSLDSKERTVDSFINVSHFATDGTLD